MNSSRTLPWPVHTRLAFAYSAVMRGVNHVSESDFPYRPFHAAHGTGPLDAEILRRVAGIGRRYRIEMGPVDDFFSQQGGLDDDGRHIAFATLEAVMRATLHEIRIARVGRNQTPRVRTFVLGIAADGLAGLRTLAIET